MTAEKSSAPVGTAADPVNPEYTDKANTNNPTEKELLEDDDNHKDIGFLRAKCSLLQNQLALVRAQQKQKKEQRKKEKGEIVSTFKSMKEYIDHLEKENQKFKDLLAPATSDDELTMLRRRVLRLEQENQRLKQQFVTVEIQCQELTSRNSKLQSEISQSKTTEAQLRDQVSKYEQVVDRVPPAHIMTSQMPQSNSMSVMADASDTGSRSATLADESLFDAKEDHFGKVVDLTPITPKAPQGRTVAISSSNNKSSSNSSAVTNKEDTDTVFGVADRAELASIQDLDDEEDDENETGVGEEWAGSVAADNVSVSLRMDAVDNVSNNKLVDQVPPSLLKNSNGRGFRSQKGPSSVAALPDASIASGGRLMPDDNTVGEDDNNLFGKMVDTTPDLSSPYSFKKTGSSVSFKDNNAAGEDDTILGVTEKLEIESVARQDDEVYSHDGTATVDDDLDQDDDDGFMSTAGGISLASIKFNVQEEKNLVDHVPPRRSKQQHTNRQQQQRDASVVAIADYNSVSSPINDDDDTINIGIRNTAFGPIVDHTPSVVPMSTKSIATSVVTQKSLFTDLNDDYGHGGGDADTLGPTSTVGDGDWDRDSLSASINTTKKVMVDHVPKRNRRLPTDLSVRVYMDNNLDNMSQVDTIAEDEEMEFGPIVDQTPFSAAKSVVSNSTRSMLGVSVAGLTAAVAGDTTTQDYNYDFDTVQDTFMDTGTIASIQEEGDDSNSSAAEEENVVDHVPLRRKMRSNTVDESVRVLVDANEDMSQVDTIAEDGILDDFGPIVDHTPRMDDADDAVTPSCGGRSVAASTAAIGDNNRTEGDLDSMAIHTIVTADLTLGLLEGESFVLLAGEEEEKHVVDHVPKEESRPLTIDGSVQVVVDQAETLSQVDTVAEDERVAFGPIVDHTPAFSVARSVGRSVGASMISVGSNDDSTSILDNTTIGFGIGGSVGGGDDTGNLDDNSAPAYRPSAYDEKKLVDHVPQSSFPKSEDVSVVVQADPLDAVFEVDDETGDGNVRTDRYGPIVDQTPLMRPSTAPSVVTSMMTMTSDAAIDLRPDDGTWLSSCDTIGEVNSRDTDQPLVDSLEESEDVGQGLSEAVKRVMVETVNSYDSDDLTDDAYVRVSKEDDSNEKVNDDDAKQSIASDEDGVFGLKEMQNYAEELAAKASESKDNPFDIDSHPQSSPEKVNSDVQEYLASLAWG